MGEKLRKNQYPQYGADGNRDTHPDANERLVEKKWQNPYSGPDQTKYDEHNSHERNGEYPTLNSGMKSYPGRKFDACPANAKSAPASNNAFTFDDCIALPYSDGQYGLALLETVVISD
ncbi:MAG TPA: hypothetical protein VHU87_13835 [Rhizomicrobium sp.]|jgi:hypothetical protein|nr:hypothetical protein [Rhizomicrobium sp.]